MTLIEAVRSGKRFRRVTRNCWTAKEGSHLYIPWSDILENDYEVEEPKRSFSEAELREAIKAFFSCTISSHGIPTVDQTDLVVDQVIKKLGF